MNYKTILLPLLVLLTTVIQAQDTYTLSGYIKDGSNGETLIGATVYIPSLAVGVTTNVYGFYSLSVVPGTYNAEYSYLGFENTIKEINLSQDLRMDVELTTKANELQEIVVQAEAADKNVTETQMSVNKLDIATIKSMPSLLGEVEILRSIQLLPGVSSVGEGASGFNVRGGSIDQNLVLLDEAPVYNSSHLFGFFSVFNPDAVKDVKLYKGGIPARYGGRLSSILDVRMKEGNSKNLTVNGGVGLIFSRLSIEAPIVKDKASFIIAGRRSYADILAKPFLDDGLKDSALNFYDLTVKTNYNINDKDKLFLSGYFGRDNFVFGEQAGFSWGNSTATLRWNHLFTDKMFSNFTFYFSDYDYKIQFGDESTNKFDWNASIVNYSVKPELNFYLNPKNLIRFGGQAIAYTFEPGNAVGVTEGVSIDFSLPKKYAIESGLFLENEQDLNDQIKLNYGLRYSHFNYTGKGTYYEFGAAEEVGLRRPVIGAGNEDSQWKSIKAYGNIEPRFAIKYQMAPSTSLKGSYNRTAQYIHLVSNTTASTPVDIWTPSTNNIQPQIADQIAVGYFQNLAKNKYEFSAEIYYKKMQHLVDYIDNADIVLNDALEGDLLEGEGRAYGLELLFKKTEGKFNGWVSYTLARSERLVTGINKGEWYPSRFDQTHNLSLTAFYNLSDRISFSSNFSLISGTPATFPTSRFEQQGFVIPHNSNESRNNVRIPAYHRLDFSMTLNGRKREGKKWNGNWVFSVYNLYSRKNPFSIFFRQNLDRLQAGSQVNTDAVQLAIIGSFVPSISYNFKFN